MVSSSQHVGALRGQGAIEEVTSSSEETPLNAVRLCKMGIPPNKALDMSESPHLTIGYLLTYECGVVKV